MIPSTVIPDLSTLNEAFRDLSPIERLTQLYHYWSPEEVLLTSSFGTDSALLLYWISNLQPTQIVHFLDTGYHFEETLAYKAELTQALGLEVKEVLPNAAQHAYTQEQSLWQKQPARCCFINKVQPMAGLELDYNVWISGLKRYQTPHRETLDIFEQKDNIIKFYPLIDISEEAFEAAYAVAALPRHPLQALGYHSIGCWHCTQRGKGRSGRWQGQDRTECGLHGR